MSPKSDKLAQRIQDIKNLIASAIARDEKCADIARELEKITDSLKTGKLNIHIYSRFPILAQALENFLPVSGTLPEFYQFKAASMPAQQPAAPTSPATLILQSAGATVQQQTRYLLSLTQDIVIGRRPGCQIQIQNQYDKVSGHHAEIKLISGNPVPSWQICDRSTNGTYINGQKLQGCQTLEADDRITLAYTNANQKAVEFIFECDSNAPAEQIDEVEKQLADCDVLCFAVNPAQMISNEEKQFLEKASKMSLSKLIVVVDTSSNSTQINQVTNVNFAEIKARIQNQLVRHCSNIVPLALRSFYPNARTTGITASEQAEMDDFRQSLETLAKGEVENILMKRITRQVLSQVSRIEKVINSQEYAIVKQIEKTEAELQAGGSDALKEQAKKAVKKANDEKDKFFRQVKVDINQSKSDVLDSFRKSSILNKIQDFAERLRPVVVTRHSESYVQLSSESTTNADGVTNAMTHLCRSELSQWGNEEWRRILTEYVEGGFNGLIQRVYAILNIIPSLKLPDSLYQAMENVDIAKSLQASLVERPWETPLKQVSMMGYIFKNIRGLVTSIISMIVTFTSVLNVTKSSLAALPLLLLPFLVIYLFYDYNQNRGLKQQEEGAKLKKELCDYYQSLAKSFVDKIVQSFNIKLESEERRMREILEEVTELFMRHFAELEKGQVTVKTRLEQHKGRQNELKKQKAELDKLKITLS